MDNPKYLILIKLFNGQIYAYKYNHVLDALKTFKSNGFSFSDIDQIVSYTNKEI